MTRKYVTVYKEVEVDVDVEMNDFDDDDLVEEIEKRGYTVYRNDRGDTSLDYLYSTYLTTPRETFEKELKKYFREKLGVNTY